MRVQRIYFSQNTIHEIKNSIANQSPESGGLLMGPTDKDAITLFHYDNQGSRSGTTYTPDADYLSEIASKINREEGWIIKGIVHSHPGAMSSLSYGDQKTIQRYFSSNPGMTYFVAPIVYRDDSGDPNAVQLQGRCCNLMAVHIIHWDELNNNKALSRIIKIEEFSNLDDIPPSNLPFGIQRETMPNKQIDRKKRDSQEMKKNAPNAYSEIIDGAIVWYEWLNYNRRKYQLSYWFDENQYKAAVIEGINPDFGSLKFISSEGMINISSLGKNQCDNILEARKRAIKALSIQKKNSPFLSKFPRTHITSKDIVNTILLIGIFLVLLANLKITNEFFKQQSIPSRWEYKVENIEGSNFQINIQKLGKDGWELVSSYQTINSKDTSKTMTEYLFKRKKFNK